MQISDFPLVCGEFVARPNRFIARVKIKNEGVCQEVVAHVPNTGRLRELLIPGAEVQMAYNPSPKRKTDYTLLMVNYGGIPVCIHAAMANALAAEYMEKQPGIKGIKREVTFKNSRFDLAFEDEGKPCLYEVKSANLVLSRIAKFPDAPTKRGSKHLEELMLAQKKGYKAGVLFVVMREDADFFMPNTVMDPEFAGLLKKGQQEGLDIRALRCQIDAETMTIKDEIEVRL